MATVTNGVVKGISAGTATITATTKDGGFTDTCEVTVTQNAVTGVRISEKLIDLGMGYKKQITATVMPDDATDKSVEWTSENPEIATVSDNGTITGKSYGRTVVTATTTDGGYTAKCVVRVKPIDVVDATGNNEFVSEILMQTLHLQEVPTVRLFRKQVRLTVRRHIKILKFMTAVRLSLNTDLQQAV